MNIPILYEDTDILVIDKPSGIVVNESNTVTAETVQSWAGKRLGIDPKAISKDPTNSDFYARCGIVHRLDKETSGVLVLAKNPESFIKLQEQFKERVTKKEYRALSRGRVVPSTGTINAPIGRLPWNRTHFGIIPGGREAVTDYKVLSYYQTKEGEQASLLSVIPHTGRTHQIRVHLHYIKFPIVGDELYSGRKNAKNDRLWCPRLFLHAYSLILNHPSTGKKMNFVCELPGELSSVLDSLTKEQ